MSILYGNAIEIDTSAVQITDVAGSGKPGLLTALIRSGDAMPADDVAGIVPDTGRLPIQRIRRPRIDVWLWCIHHWDREMVRTQIYLIECQRDELAAIARHRSKRQSEVIREAVDRFIEQWSRHGRERILRETAGI